VHDNVRSFLPLAYLGARAVTHIRKNDIVCDYHGRLISKETSNKIYNSVCPSDRRSDYLMTLPFNGGIYYAAHEEFCPCHPKMRTIGRLLNFASKTGPSAHQCNLKLRFYDFLELDGAPKGCLFVASRDILPLEELRYDYGDNNCREMFL
jgi:hypothetical protein